MSENPLLSTELEIPFDRIRSEHVEPGIRSLLEQAQARLDAIASCSEPRTYDNTLGALDEATSALDVAMTTVGHLEAVASSPELREAYNAIKPDVSAFYAGIPLQNEVYRALVDYSKTEDAAALTGARRRYLDKTLDDFRREGAELDPAGKARLQGITRELAELTAKFAQNVLDATARFELVIEDEATLAGLPDSARAAARQSAEEKGRPGWRFTLQAPSLIPLLAYLEDGGIRELVYRAHTTKASKGQLANPPLVARILELRAEQAQLLGYASFADLVLEDRMAKTGAQATLFVEDLARRSREAFVAENEELLAFRREIEGPDAPALQPWDVAYYAEKLRQARFAFDEEELRPYFPAHRVVQGLFDTAERLFGIRVRPTERFPTWHEDVSVYEVEEEDGTFIAAFFIDLHPRETKRGGAWMNCLVPGVFRDGRPSPHLALMCANVSPPVDDQPALLTHQEVSTLFHEFGHLLHQVLSRVEVRSLSGTNVAWDFVELPSQLLENWCWEKAGLDLFARHFQSAEEIPNELFDKLLRTRTFREANAMMRQLGFATLDLALHTSYEPGSDGELLGYCRELMQGFAPAPYPDDYAFFASFGHLFASSVGYAAGYYSYKWAEVLDADAFTRFRREGIFSREAGRAFRDAILSRGDGDAPGDLYREFMGRDPALEPLLVRSGLVPASVESNATPR